MDALAAEHAELSWRLIEWKVAYYLPEFVHHSRRNDVTVDDDTYDATERRYLTLCLTLGKNNTVVHKVYPGFEDVPGTGMMEVDQSRPSVQLVLRKLREAKPRGRRKASRGAVRSQG